MDIEMQDEGTNLFQQELFQAADEGNGVAIVTLIGQDGRTFEDVTQPNTNYFNRTLLHYACSISDTQEATKAVQHVLNVITALNHGYNELEQFVNRLDNNKESALQIAVRNGHDEIIEILLRNNAKVSIGFNAQINRRFQKVLLKTFDSGLHLEPDEIDKSNEYLWSFWCNFSVIAGKPKPIQESNYDSFRETQLLAAILKQPKRKTAILLLHPLVQLFVHVKYEKYKWIFRASQILQILWFMMVTLFLYGYIQNKEANAVNQTKYSLDSFTNDTGHSIRTGIITNSISSLSELFGGEPDNHEESSNLGEIIVTNNSNPVNISGTFENITSTADIKSYDHIGSQFWFGIILLLIWLIFVAKEIVLLMLISNKWNKYKEFETWGQVFVLVIIGFSWWLHSWIIYIAQVVTLFLIQGEFVNLGTFEVQQDLIVKAFVVFGRMICAFVPILSVFMAVSTILLSTTTGFVDNLAAQFSPTFKVFTKDSYETITFAISFSIVFGLFLAFGAIIVPKLFFGLCSNDTKKLLKRRNISHVTSRLELLNIMESFILGNISQAILEKFGIRDFIVRKFTVGLHDKDQPDLVKNRPEGLPKEFSYQVAFVEIPNEMKLVLLKNKAIFPEEINESDYDDW